MLVVRLSRSPFEPQLSNKLRMSKEKMQIRINILIFISVKIILVFKRFRAHIHENGSYFIAQSAIGILINLRKAQVSIVHQVIVQKVISNTYTASFYASWPLHTLIKTVFLILSGYMYDSHGKQVINFIIQRDLVLSTRTLKHIISNM